MACRDRHVVILGAGETSELTAQALAHQGVGTIFVANRHADRALSLAQRFGGSVVGLDKLPEQLLEADIVVSSTSSPHPIVGSEELELVMEQRTGRPLLLIDIAVPRDIDSRCGDIEGVTLYDIDDLQAVVAAQPRRARTKIVPQAEEIVEEEIRRFARWLGQLETLPTVAALREHGNALVEQILAENAGRWESASERDLMRVEAVARAVLGRLLHEPTIRLRSSLAGARAREPAARARAVRARRGAAARGGRGRRGRRSSPRCARSRAPARANDPTHPAGESPRRGLPSPSHPAEEIPSAGPPSPSHPAEEIPSAGPPSPSHPAGETSPAGP